MPEVPVHALDNAGAHRVLLAPRGVAGHSTAARHGYSVCWASRPQSAAVQSTVGGLRTLQRVGAVSNPLLFYRQTLWPGTQGRHHGVGAQVLLLGSQGNGCAQEDWGVFRRPGRVQTRLRRSGALVTFLGPRCRLLTFSFLGVNTSVLVALQRALKIDIWRSMIASACQHFHFGGATASLKNWHMPFHDCGHFSTLPFWGRYNVPCLQALVNTSILGALQQAWKIGIWRSMIAGTCQHFHFLGGATASLKNWHMTFHDCRHLSTLPCFFSKAFVHPGSSFCWKPTRYQN